MTCISAVGIVFRLSFAALVRNVTRVIWIKILSSWHMTGSAVRTVSLSKLIVKCDLWRRRSYVCFNLIFIFRGSTAPVRLGLLVVEVSRSHSDTPRLVRFLRTSDQPGAENSAWQHATVLRDRHPCHRRDSNPQSEQANGCIPTPKTTRLLGSALF